MATPTLRILDGFEAPTERVADVMAPPPGKIEGTGRAGWLIDHSPVNGYILTNRLLKAGVPVFWQEGETRAGRATLAPGALSESTPHEAGVIEHVVVVSGELEMKLEGKWQTISADSGVRFAGDKPHAYRNSSDRTVHFHSLIHYPR